MFMFTFTLLRARFRLERLCRRLLFARRARSFRVADESSRGDSGLVESSVSRNTAQQPASSAAKVEQRTDAAADLSRFMKCAPLRQAIVLRTFSSSLSPIRLFRALLPAILHPLCLLEPLDAAASRVAFPSSCKKKKKKQAKEKKPLQEGQSRKATHL